MKTLEERISALKDEIDGYVAELNVAGVSEAKGIHLFDMIKTGRETLTILLDERNKQSTGSMCFSWLGLLMLLCSGPSFGFI